ncbi:MAG: C-terminal helicase domain-containing protein [Bacteroidota bacterium]
MFTVEFVLQLIKQLQQVNTHKYRLGVICPYKAQATLVEKLLAQQHQENDKTEVLVGTIHGFQGDECDIIISIFNPPLSISQHPGMFLNRQNILNVSISRARDYLFVIMLMRIHRLLITCIRSGKLKELIHEHAGNRMSVYPIGKGRGSAIWQQNFYL